jgi:hypothetical protein
MGQIGIFGQAVAAMPISDYANAFFFARRKRVTLSGLGYTVARSRLLFQKPARSITAINIVAVIADCVNPSSYIRQKNLRRNPGQSEFREAETGCAEADETKEARQCRASLTNIFSDQFISRALRSDGRAARPFGSHCSCE